MKFTDFGLAEPLARALAEKGYADPTPIQIQAIPPVLEGKDLCGIAQTGTGKTAAFALPTLHRLAATPKHRLKYATRCLVLAPTRELVSQIAASFQSYGKFMKLSVTTVFGGVPISRQDRAMAPGVDVVVATPGRLLDLVERGSLDLRNVEVLVLDEADQMLDLGFIHDLRRIVGLLPRQRQTLFFSATMPKAIEELAGRYLTNPVKVAVQPAATTAERVDQAVIFVGQMEKPALLQLVLANPSVERALVFTRTKHGADRVVRQLASANIVAEAIHGNKSQPQRERALAGFKHGTVKVLVATDIAARGIDVSGVSHVINYELPNVPEQYVHRIGRTARAGADGQAIAFCADDERPFLKDIEKTIRQKVSVLALPANFREAVAHTAKLAKLAPPAPRDDEPPRTARDDFARRPTGPAGRRSGRPGRDSRVQVKPAARAGGGGGGSRRGGR
ncbi:DEAD/DEAH box helicase [Sandarakinorhabdus sp.]|uniref:DEAD/DEAH box helicase n=1 Tax=Sandarakinorhabdus sp. TaxID=1916663 RepID=UPI00286EA99E|nr:DEAD/DEAH box helicase [Sandarakinorhabdus sp.]